MGTKRRVCRGAKRERNVAPEPDSDRDTFVLVWWGVGWGGVDSFPFGSILIGTAASAATTGTTMVVKLVMLAADDDG